MIKVKQAVLLLLLSFCVCQQSARAAIPTSERDALIALYNATDGANWTNNTGWLGAVGTECSWYGVTCGNNHITSLALQNNQLTGSLPAELGFLSQLRFLGFFGNQLSGDIPLALGQLSLLEQFDAAENQLNGSIPSEFGLLVQLRHLSLANNQLSGNIPTTLGNLSLLERLDLTGNQLNGSIPVALMQLSQLRGLYLSGNQFSGSIPPELGQLGQLQALELYNNQLSGSIPPELGQLSQLRRLGLGGNQLSGTIPVELEQLSQLQDLSLAVNQLTGTIPVELGQLSQLQSLHLNNNQLGGSIPAELGQLSQLRHLFLSSNQISGNIPVALGQLSLLEVLDLSNNQLIDMAPQIAQLTGLFWLTVQSNCLNEATLAPAVVTFLDQKNGPWRDGQGLNCSVASDQPPVVIITTPGNSDNNPKNANFDLDVSVTDDIGLSAVAYSVLTWDFGSTGQKGVVYTGSTIAGLSFPIDVASLPIGSYKIQVKATDSKSQASVDQWYWFQKNTETGSDQPPIVTITTPGSSDNNLKNANFSLDVTVNDDVALSAVAYSVLTSSYGSTGQKGVQTLTGSGATASFPIDVASLPIGSYKIQVKATDSLSQVSSNQWYWFQKDGNGVADQPPVVTITTPGSSDNNPKTANFNLDVAITDDLGLSAVAFNVLTSGFGSTGKKDIQTLAGSSATVSFPIDVASLPIGSYKIQVKATDSKSQASIDQWYWFQKEASVILPTVSAPTVSKGGVVADSKELRFSVKLSGPLPDGYGVFINFDDQQGGWLADNASGGRLVLQSQGGNVYATDYALQKPGVRMFRAGIFKLNAPANTSDDTLMGTYSAPATCTLAFCFTVNTYGDPAVMGNGSQLFKNVDVANGNYHVAETDLGVDGKGPAFSFSRAYNSLALSPWSFGYEAKAKFVANSFDRQIAIGPREDGHLLYFYKDLDGKWYTLNPGNFDQLVENGDGSFVLYTQGNRLYRFANPSSAQGGRLQSIEDRLGNALAFGYNASNRLIGATDANGRTYTISRDANNRISRVTDFTGRYVEYGYNANGMITTVRNPRGGIYKYGYEGTTGLAAYRLASITDPRGNVQMHIGYQKLGVNIDGSNDIQYRVAVLTDGANNATKFSYNLITLTKSPFYGKQVTGIRQPGSDGVNNNLAFILDDQRSRVENRLDTIKAVDYVRSQTYQALLDRQHLAETALIERIDDPKRNATSISYDDIARNRPAVVKDAGGYDHLAAYDLIPDAPNLPVMTSTTQPGNFYSTLFDNYTSTGKAGKITDPLGHVTLRSFEAQNNWLTDVTNPRGNTTAYDYDVYGHVKTTSEPLGRQTQREYDDLGRVTQETSPSGLVTSYTYDQHGNILTKNEQAAGIDYTTNYVYDASDNLIWTVDPRGHRTDYFYDALNRKIKETYAVAGVPHQRLYAYDALGRLKTVTNERNQKNTTQYDLRGLVTQKTNPLSQTTVYTYDANGNVATVTDAEGRSVTHAYDQLNRKIEERDESGSRQTWSYHPNGQVASHTDARGKLSQYSYDANGNLTQTQEDGNVSTASYDANGNLLTVTDANGHTTTYAYDALDRRISTKLHNGETWQYAYDVAGNQTSEITPTGEKTLQSFDALGRVTLRREYDANGSLTREVAYGYDANGNVTSLTSGGATTSYGYDEVNRISSVTDQYGQTLGYGYDKAGNRTRLVYPGNKAVNYAYDNADRLLSMTDWLNKTTKYTRNKAGQVTQVVNGNGTKAIYGYDNAGRLIQLKNLQANGSVISRHDLTLDGSGNITQADVSLPLNPTLPNSIASLNYDANNRLLSADGTSYSHDQTGRIVQKDASGTQTVYSFDINDHISSITQAGNTVSQYAYDLNDNRISQTQNGTETRYVIDSLASLPNAVAETTAQGNVLRYYLYGEGLVSQIDASGSSHYYHYDPTGHTLALSDSRGAISDKYAYTPYGHTATQGTTPNPFKFVGKHGVMDDGNGLHYMRARYYKEDIMRFMSLDALHGDMLTPQALNRYAYVMGNPVMGIDPSGLACEDADNSSKTHSQLGYDCSYAKNSYINSELKISTGTYTDRTIKANEINVGGGVNILTVEGNTSSNFLNIIDASMGAKTESKTELSVKVKPHETEFYIGACVENKVNPGIEIAGVEVNITVGGNVGGCVDGKMSILLETDSKISSSIDGAFAAGLGLEGGIEVSIDKSKGIGKLAYKGGEKLHQTVEGLNQWGSDTAYKTKQYVKSIMSSGYY